MVYWRFHVKLPASTDGGSRRNCALCCRTLRQLVQRCSTSPTRYGAALGGRCAADSKWSSWIQLDCKGQIDWEWLRYYQPKIHGVVLVPGMIEIIAIFEDPNESTESSSILRERCSYLGPTVENPQVPHSPYMYFNHGPWSVQAMSCSVFPPRLRASKISVIVVWVGFRTPVWPQFCSFALILQVYATMFGEPESLSLRNTQASFFEAQTAEPLVIMNNLTMCISICAALAAGEADINFSNPRGRMPLHVESPAWACQPPVPGAGRHCSHSVIQGFWML